MITSNFDFFMLLHAGSTVYFGPWAECVDYFAGHGCPCPQVCEELGVQWVILSWSAAKSLGDSAPGYQGLDGATGLG
jgi:hypothetical protein